MSRKLAADGGRRRKLPFRTRVLGTVGCVVLYRLLACLPLPFADRAVLSGFLAGRQLGLFEIMSGGGMSRLSVATLGISPYISASIIMQLLGAVVPVVSLLQRSGPVGQKKIRDATMSVSAAVSVVSGTTLALSYRSAGILPQGFVTGLVAPVAAMAACSVGLARLGCYVDEKLFGRGTSILLLAGVLASLPGTLAHAGAACADMAGPAGAAGFAAGCVLFFFLAFLLVNCRMELPLSYSGKPVSGDGSLASVSVLPLMAMPGSVMPVVFASYFLSLASIVSFAVPDPPAFLAAFDMSAWFDPARPAYTLGAVAYCLLIFLFGRVSQVMSVNGGELAENLRRGGCTVAGVAGGKETEAYLTGKIRSVTRFGSLGLCAMAVLPVLCGAVLGLPGIGYMGTSVLLAVSVTQEVLSEALAYAASGRYVRCMEPMRKGPRSGNPYALLDMARTVKHR